MTHKGMRFLSYMRPATFILVLAYYLISMKRDMAVIALRGGAWGALAWPIVS